MSFYYYHEWYEAWKRYANNLSIIDELIAEGKCESNKHKEYISKVKQISMPRIRELNKAYDKYLEEPQWRIPFGYADDCYDSRAIFYEEPYVVEDKAKYIDENWQHWYNPYEDGRDCTGVWFTSYISVFPIPQLGKTIVYHVQNCDV